MTFDQSMTTEADNALWTDWAIATVLERRSIKRFTESGPTNAQLDVILEAATTVPDHNELRPWRFVVISGDNRAAFGEALVAAGVAKEPELIDARRNKLRDKAFVAPTFVVIIFSPEAGNVEFWEQEASAATTGYAMVLTAHLLGLGAIWKSAPIRTGERLCALLDLGADEQLMGWVNLGTPATVPRAKNNPVGPADVATRLVDGRLVGWGQSSDSGQG